MPDNPGMTDQAVRFANPFLICAQCGNPVTGASSHEGMPLAASHNLPCRHRARALSLCPNWQLIDGCTCVPVDGVVVHPMYG